MNSFVKARRVLALCTLSLIALVSASPTPLFAQGPAGIIISEVHPSGSGNLTYKADWIEITNTSAVAVDITGWKIDDNSNLFANAVSLRNVTLIPAGKSAVFIETAATTTDAAVKAAFSTAWFGTPTPPPGVLIGAYSGSGIGLGNGDGVNLFTDTGAVVTAVSLGSTNAAFTFDNVAGIGSNTMPGPTISTLSTAGLNGAFTASGETGSPGRIAAPPSFSAIDLATYVRIGRFPLPEPLSVPLPPGTPASNLLAQEASAVTYNWDTDTLFITGDGGRAITQVTKEGQLIDTMTLALGGSSQGTDFLDPEGLTYVGNGQFVMSEERDRQAVLFTYAAGTTLARANAQTVKLGTAVGNIGNEGLTYDPLTHGFVFVKETQPQGIFQTNIDFAAHTSTNGSETAEPVDLFSPSLLGLADLADVFALANLPTITGPGAGNLLVLSQESGRILNVDRNGNIASALTILQDPGELPVSEVQHEGLTMDGNGILYVVNENGGGNIDHPQLWVYAPSAIPNQAPTGLSLLNQINSLPENSIISPRRKVADVVIADDGLGVNILAVSGADAASFEVDATGLYLKNGISLDFETKPAYSVTVSVDDPAFAGGPEATTTFALNVTDVFEAPATPVTIAITEIAPWGSGANNTPYAADWFEITNTGTTPATVSGWKFDDDSDNFGAGSLLTGIGTIGPGESVIFMENNAAARAAFLSAWFGPNAPPTLQIGGYSGNGLSTSGDHVNIFDGGGTLLASVVVGPSPAGPFPSFDNAAFLSNGATITQLSAIGVNGAFAAINHPAEIGSPGQIAAPASLIISEVAPWSNDSPGVGADWFEVTNIGLTAANITGWKMDDVSESPGGAAALAGVTTIAPGESVIFLETETPDATRLAFINNWFGGNAPAGLQIGSYSGSGVGLSAGSGDAVNLFNQFNVLKAKVTFGPASIASPLATFDNAAGINLNPAAISLMSVAGVNGAFTAANAAEVGSPGTIFPDVTAPTVTYTGNAGTYALNQTVSIQCVATDASGIASTTCANISGPAYSFSPGVNTFSATATDVAGNQSAPVSTSFTITVSTPALQTLVGKFSTKPLATLALNVTLQAAALVKNPIARVILLQVFEQEVKALTGKALTPAQAAILIGLSRGQM